MTVDRTIGRSIGQNCPKRQIMFLKTHKGINVSVLMKNFLVFLSDCLNDQAIWLQLGTLKGAQIRADSRKHFKRCVSISRLLSRLSFLWSNDRPFNNAKTYHRPVDRTIGRSIGQNCPKRFGTNYVFSSAGIPPRS